MDNPDEIKEEIEHQEALKRGYRKRLRKLEEQAAIFGLHVPPHIDIEIDELKERIEECDKKIQSHRGIELIYGPQQLIVIDKEPVHPSNLPRILTNRKVSNSTLNENIVTSLLNLNQFEQSRRRPAATIHSLLVGFTTAGTYANATRKLILFFIVNANVNDNEVNTSIASITQQYERHFTNSDPKLLVVTCFVYDNIIQYSAALLNLRELLKPLPGNFQTWIIERESNRLYKIHTDKSLEYSTYMYSNTVTLLNKLTKIIIDVAKLKEVITLKVFSGFE